MKIHCKFDALLDPKDLKHHPKNRNKHSQDQIERLAKILDYQGWRYAIKISNQSGFVTSGHGRILAALHQEWKTVPVVHQDYESEEQEYADVQADNAIASWAELDLASINLDVPDLGPDFDIDLLGIKDFVLEPADKMNMEEHAGQLSAQFMIPPFSVLNAREGWWQDRKRFWISLGIQSEIGRGGGSK